MKSIFSTTFNLYRTEHKQFHRLLTSPIHYSEPQAPQNIYTHPQYHENPYPTYFAVVASIEFVTITFMAVDSVSAVSAILTRATRTLIYI